MISESPPGSAPQNERSVPVNSMPGHSDRDPHTQQPEDKPGSLKAGMPRMHKRNTLSTELVDTRRRDSSQLDTRELGQRPRVQRNTDQRKAGVRCSGRSTGFGVVVVVELA